MLDLLFSPIRIGAMEVKNRLAVSPMVCNYCTPDGEATEQFIAYHEEKAKGGWGLIITENYAITQEGRGFTNMACMWCDELIQSHRQLTERVHLHGAKIVAQMTHAGRQTEHTLTGMQPVAPSAIPCPDKQEMPHELTVAEIKKTVSYFGDAARRMMQAGFDGVEVHGGHGYLIAQFMSPYANKRVDEYGGVLYNRLRFAREVIEDIRAKTSPDFPILFRISSAELMPGGRTIQDTMAIAVLLEQWGVHAIDITCGTYGEGSTIPTMASPHAWNVDAAEQVKKVVSIPVMAVGRIIDPILAETVIRAGKADMVIMGRGSLADPELPNKAMEGRFDRIRQCIGCLQGCIGRLVKGQPIACLVNPQLGFEWEKIEKAAKPLKVCVVGGGPAGIEAARGAAMRGHSVTLFEKKDRLGGSFGIAAYPPYKGELASYAGWAKLELADLGVDVRLNKKVDAAMIKDGKYDAVVIATGARLYVPESVSIKGDNTLDAQELIAGKTKEPGKKCAVLGGGLVGLEAAVHLGWMGRDVTIIEMMDTIAADVESGVLPSLLELVDRYNVKVVTGAKVSEIDGKTVVYETCGGKTSQSFDTIVLAIGLKPETSLIDKLKDYGITVISAGDALAPRKALDATREGFAQGSRI